MITAVTSDPGGDATPAPGTSRSRSTSTCSRARSIVSQRVVRHDHCFARRIGVSLIVVVVFLAVMLTAAGGSANSRAPSLASGAFTAGEVARHGARKAAAVTGDRTGHVRRPGPLPARCADPGGRRQSGVCCIRQGPPTRRPPMIVTYTGTARNPGHRRRRRHCPGQRRRSPPALRGGAAVVSDPVAAVHT